MIEQDIDKAVEVLRLGGIVAYPTDTAYGLAVDATNVEAIKSLYALKGRNFKRPIHLIFPSFLDLNRAVKLNSVAKKLIQNFFPGPLTIVLPLKSQSKPLKLLSANTGTLGFRMPDHPIVRLLIKNFGKAITTTSANKSGKKNCYTIAQVKKQFGKAKFVPDFYLDGGKLKPTKPSTVVSVVENKVKVLREGPISSDEIKNIVGL